MLYIPGGKAGGPGSGRSLGFGRILVPTYDYECDSCGRTYEVWQKISAAPLTSCQYCGGPVHRLLAPAPFILKGGGWYVTDYPSESRKKAMEAEKKTADSTPATKTSDGGSAGASSSTASSPASSGSGGSPAKS